MNKSVSVVKILMNKSVSVVLSISSLKGRIYSYIVPVDCEIITDQHGTECFLMIRTSPINMDMVELFRRTTHTELNIIIT